MYILRFKLDSWMSRHQHIIPLHEREYLTRARTQFPDKLARFRMTLKAHKTPWKMRPIVCCAGTFMNCWSKWLDSQFQKLKHFVPTYVQGTSHILSKLKDINDLPPHAYTFTAGANAMYNNINMNHAIKVISAWLDELSTHPKFPTDFALEAVKEAMKIIMTNNIFQFGTLLLLQLLDTAMGTYAAVMWATLYFGYHEVKTLLPNFSNCNCTHFNGFKSALNNFGILTWTVDKPSKKCTFLDLNIKISGPMIKTTTYQKPLNLHLYLPGPLAHPKCSVKGTIFGLLRRYRKQNTLYQDYI
ncbi:hypothetical protein ACHAWF_003326, partial [Thalassiosira exigua]